MANRDTCNQHVYSFSASTGLASPIHLSDCGHFLKSYRGGSRGGPPLTTKNEAPAPKFYKTKAPEWQF